VSDRWTEITESEYVWEKEAFTYLKRHLPDREPYRAWSNFEFIAHNGFINEVDVLVLSRNRLYLVEIKSRPGRLTGDAGTWKWHREGRPLYDDNPRKLANLKAKKLKSVLEPYMRQRKVRMPFIEAIVFLSNQQTQCQLDESGRAGVHLRHGIKGDSQPHIIEVLFQRDADGALRLDNDDKPIDSAQARALKWAMGQAGIRRSQKNARVGDYRIEELLRETALYQDWLGRHVSLEKTVRRLRIYPVAPDSTPESRTLQQRAAKREFELLEGLDHPGILKASQYSPNERGECLVYEHDVDAQRLDALIEHTHKKMDVGRRIDLLRRIAEAVKYAHGHNVFHRMLSPQTVYVSKADTQNPAVKVTDWQTGVMAHETQTTVQTQLGQTLHVDLVGEDTSLLYAAPELRSGHSQDGQALDIHALGAIAYHLFSGEPPAYNLEQLEQQQRSGNGLSLSAVQDGGIESLEFLILTATDPQADMRPSSVGQFLELLDEVEEELTAPGAEDGVHPKIARPGDRLTGGFSVIKRIGSGSTGFALLVKHDDGREGVLKVADTPEHNERILKEAETLAPLRHPNIVQLYDTVEIQGHQALFMAKAGTDNKGGALTLAHRLRQDGRLSLDLLQRFGTELLDTLVWMELNGVSHRDIKPDNIGIASAARSGALTLVLFDFSLSGVSPDNIRAGTLGYLDPFLRLRRPPRWDVAAERYAAAVTLHEMATGQLPDWGDGQSDPAAIEWDVTLEVDQFDTSVRERLTHFFRVALSRDVPLRFDNAELMRESWREVFRYIDSGTITTSLGDEEEIDYKAIFELATRETPLAQLGLSPRLLDALDRLGAHTIAELVNLKGIRLYRNRGLGGKVVAEIRELSRHVPAHLRNAPASSVAEAVVRQVDDEERQSANEHWSVDRLTKQLVTDRIDPEEADILRKSLGLVQEGESFAAPADVARRLDISTVKLRATFTAARQRWVERPWMTSLRTDVATIVYRHAGVLTPSELADGLLAMRGSHLEGESRSAAALAVAQAAIEAESERINSARFELYRSGARVLIVATSTAEYSLEATTQARARYALALGDACDAMAQEDTLLAPERVVERLAAVQAPSGDEPMTTVRQRLLGVATSTQAALSTRMEIYPRGMDNLRALRLGAGSLLGPKALSCEEVVSRIGSRYPMAQPLPTLPSRLADLLRAAETGFIWNNDKKQFLRPQSALSRFTESTLHRSGGATVGEEAEAKARVAARKVDELLQNAIEKRRFLVIAASPRRLQSIAERLTIRFALQTISLERELISALDERLKAINVQWQTVLRADSPVRTERDAQRLSAVVRQAVDAVAETVDSTEQPQLLLHAGLLARYGELRILTAWQEQADTNHNAPVRLLLLPMDEQSSMPMIDGVPFAVPLASRFVRLGGHWLDFTNTSVQDTGNTPSRAAHAS